MADLINELAVQAGAELYGSKEYTNIIVNDQDADALMRKFAELIVQECMKVAVFKDSGMIATADVAGYMAAGRSTAARMIKEHFGVEE